MLLDPARYGKPCPGIEHLQGGSKTCLTKVRRQLLRIMARGRLETANEVEGMNKPYLKLSEVQQPKLLAEYARRAWASIPCIRVSQLSIAMSSQT